MRTRYGVFDGFVCFAVGVFGVYFGGEETARPLRFQLAGAFEENQEYTQQNPPGDDEGAAERLWERRASGEA